MTTRFTVACSDLSPFMISQNGTPFVVASFRDQEGTRHDKSLYFSEKAAEYSVKSLRAMGWKGTDLSRLALADLTSEVDVVVNVNDKGQEEVAIFEKSSGGTRGEALSPQQVATLAKRFAKFTGGNPAKIQAPVEDDFDPFA